MSIEGKDVYILDNFFLEDEAEGMLEFSKKGQFCKKIFADQKSEEKGEEPDRAMDNKEKWRFFANPLLKVPEFDKYYAISEAVVMVIEKTL